jgi:regulator of sirC expression with transglutaminase-like and TPR domain
MAWRSRRWRAATPGPPVELYKRAQNAHPGHAAAWRGAGLAYEKLGEKPAARAAYQRYLQLAPTAPDAAGIRRRLEAP